MPITIDESLTSRKWSTTAKGGKIITFNYIIRGTNDDVAVDSLLVANILANGYQDALYDSHDQKLMSGAGDIWEGVIVYKQPNRAGPQKPDDPSQYTFSTKGGTKHINQSLETVSKHFKAGVVPHEGYKKTIGLQADGKIQGTDIIVPVFNFTLIRVLPASTVTTEYEDTVAALTGKVNSVEFRGSQPGEVLFHGADGRQDGDIDSDFTLTFEFSRILNEEGIEIGDIAGINKKGYEYIWARYEDELDEVDKMVKKVPFEAYVEKVYELADFTALGL